MGRTRIAMLAGTALLAASAVLHAQNAYTNDVADLRAGPDESYPLVATLGPGSPVEVMGCLDDWSWCDVEFEDGRGWLYAPLLSYVYEGERVPFYSYAPTFGLPIITFSLGTYWERHYRGRPWYGERHEWEHRHVPHRRPPGPPPRFGRPPILAPGRGPRPSEGFRQRGGDASPERRAPQAPERFGHGPGERSGRPQGAPQAPERLTPGPGPRAGAPPRAPQAPERFGQGPAARTGAEPPERGPRAGGGRPSTGRLITPHREGPTPRGAPPPRGGERPSGGEHGGNRRNEGGGQPPR